MARDPRGTPVVVIGDPIYFQPAYPLPGGGMTSMHTGQIYWSKETPIDSFTPGLMGDMIARGSLARVRLSDAQIAAKARR